MDSRSNRVRTGHVCLLVAAALIALPLRKTAAQADWEALRANTAASLRGLHVVSDQVIWASGSRGTVMHSSDGGNFWAVDTIPGGAAFDIRSIHGRGERVAHAAATAGRIWRTIDGGKSWSLRYQATDTSVFLDAISFWDDRRGMALGDPIHGRFLILFTEDGGESWHEAPEASRPAAIAGEAAFAASATSLVTMGRGLAWIGSGGKAARVHRSRDFGRSWQVSETPLQSGSGANGIFSLAFADAMNGAAVGGDYRFADSSRASAALSRDGGVTWVAASAMPRGYRSGAALRRRSGARPFAISVGTNGTDVSMDGGATWQPLNAGSYNAVQFAPGGTIYAAGDRGRLGRFDPTRQRAGRP